MSILCVGEVLWDVFADRELLGGAPLNFSAMSSRLEHDVTILTAVCDDDRGRRALASIHDLGLRTDFIQTVSAPPTGTAIVVTDQNGDVSYRIKRPAAFDRFYLEDSRLPHLRDLRPSWLYFGTLAQITPGSSATINTLRHHFPGLPCFYDINLRNGHWNFPLVQRLSTYATVLKLNQTEAETLHHLLHPLSIFSLHSFCEEWADLYHISTICITLGGEGCAIFSEGRFQKFPGFHVNVVDTVGAGDAFAAGYLHGMLQHWSIEDSARFANAVGAFVASHAGATPTWNIRQLRTFTDNLK